MILRRMTGYGPAFIFFLLLLLSWEGIVHAGQVPINVLPAPSAILSGLIENRDILLVNTIPTLLETLLGLMIATIVGGGIAILLDFSPWIRRSIYPLLITSQTIPLIALAPLLLIWFGFDLAPKVIMVVLYCIFPIAVATVDGLAATDQDLLRLLKSMDASHGQILWLVRLPAALPAFFSGLRIAATYSVTGAIIGEFVGGYQGLGIYMQTSANAHAIVQVFAAIVITALASLLLFGMVSLIERIALPWYYIKNGDNQTRKTESERRRSLLSRSE